MRMKKMLTAICAAALAGVLVLGLAACGGSDTGNESATSGNAAEEDADAGAANADDQASDAAADTSGSAAHDYVLENEVLVDDENLLIRINGFTQDSLWGTSAEVYCENKTDQAIQITLDEAVVNGYTISTLWGEEIAAGMNVTSSIDLMNTDADRGLSVADELQLYLRAYFVDDWEADNLLDEAFTVYPTGMDAGSVTYPEPVIGADAVTIAENDQARFVIYGTENDEIWGYTVLAYLENNTDEIMMFSWDGVSVNGSMCDPFWAMSLAPHTGGYADISFLDSDFEANGIETVENISFTLTASSYEDFTAAPAIDGQFTYEP